MSNAHHAESRRMHGMPLALKLAFVIAGVVAVFMAAFGIFLSGNLEETMSRQVKTAAIEAARGAAQADFFAWTSTYGTEDQGLTHEGLQAKVDEMTPFQYETWSGDEQRKATVEWNRLRFRRFVGDGSDILAAELFEMHDGKRGSLANSSYAGEMEFAPVIGQRSFTLGDGKAVMGLFTAGGLSRLAIRGSHPVRDRDDVIRGEIALYIDAAAVAEATADFKLRVAYAAMIFVLLGGIVSFALGRGVTKPLKRLQEDIRIVASGDLMHHTRTHSSDEIGDLARTFDLMTTSLLTSREGERQASASQKQVEVAAEVASSLFPDVLPDIPGCDVAAIHEGREELTGVQYDVLPMSGGRFGLLIGQASGTGAPAALVMAMARSFLRAVAARETDPGAVLREVNDLLAPDLPKGLYVSMLLAVVEPGAESITLANAGHPGFLHFHAATKKVSVVHSEGIALGFDSGPVFDRTLKVGHRALEPGDRILLHTQGVSDLPGADGTPFGEKHLGALLLTEGDLIAESFVGRVDLKLKEHTGTDDLPEDVTMLTLSRLGGGA
jgi:serine phosphatase RsbU (regulator of sigma subunit)